MFRPSIFSEMTALAVQHGALNLAQGFPEFPPPLEAVEAYRKALQDGEHQYAPMAGLPDLRRELARLDERRWGVAAPELLSWEHEWTVVPGATVGLYAAFLALVEPGDEAVVLEPAYDSYIPALRRAGARVVTTSWSHPSWEKVLSDRTRVVVVNSPHNPTGTLWEKADWDRLAQALERYPRAVVVSDEAYEWMTYTGRKACSVRQIEALRERSFRILSLGKTFHATGWKVGAVAASAAWTARFRQVYQFLAFSTNTPAQRALAQTLVDRPNFPFELAVFFQSKRDRLSHGLRTGGWNVDPCSGSYFLTVRLDEGVDDSAWAKARVVDAGVATVPMSPFYEDPRFASPQIRLCFAKNDDTLDEAVRRLNEWKQNRT